MKRSELISWLHDNDEVGYQDKNPDVILIDGINEYSILSVYAGYEKKPTIYIDIAKESK